MQLVPLYFLHPNTSWQPDQMSDFQRSAWAWAKAQGEHGAHHHAREVLRSQPSPRPPSVSSVRPTCQATADGNTDWEVQTRTYNGSTKAKKKSVKTWSIPSHLPLRSNTFEVSIMNFILENLKPLVLTTHSFQVPSSVEKVWLQPPVLWALRTRRAGCWTPR